MFSISNLSNIDAPTSNRPEGVMRDDILPGDQTGTEVEEQLHNDMYYGLVGLLHRAGLSPDDTDEGIEQSQVADSAEGLSLTSDANKLINADFRIWQRGISQTISSSSATYTADRIKSDVPGYTSGSYTASRDTGGVDTGFQYCAKFDLASLVHSNNFRIWQNLETKNVINLRSKKCMAKFRIKVSSPATFFIEVVDGTDIDADPSTSTTFSQESISVTTGWQDFYVTHTVQSGANSLKAQIKTTSGYTGIVYIQYMLLSVVDDNFKSTNSATIKYKQRNITDEIQLCQRYYEKSYDMDKPPYDTDTKGQFTFKIGDFPSTSNTIFQVHITYKNRKRTTPTVGTYNGASGPASVNLNTENRPATILKNGETGVVIQASTTTGSTDKFIIFHWTADAEI